MWQVVVIHLHPGCGVTGFHDDDTNAEVSNFVVQRLGKGLEGKLRCGVGSFERRRHSPLNGRNVDNDTVATFAHTGNDLLSHADRAQCVGLEHLANVIKRESL